MINKTRKSTMKI